MHVRVQTSRSHTATVNYTRATAMPTLGGPLSAPKLSTHHLHNGLTFPQHWFEIFAFSCFCYFYILSSPHVAFCDMFDFSRFP